MRSVLFPATALVFLTFCSPSNDRRNDTGMARSDSGTANGGAGGLSARDTMPSATSDTAAAGGAATTPAAILSELYVANTMEIQLSKLAEKKATSPKVKQVAAKLASDHAKNREQVRALTQKLNISLTPPPAGDAAATDSTALPPDLQGKSGADFDKAFVEYEIQGHQKNIEKIQNQLLPAAQDAQIKTYLQNTLTTIQGHLASLQAVQKQLG
jgi:putative membrane protein